MKNLFLAALVLMCAVNVHAASVWLGTPFVADKPFGGGTATWVPIMGSGLPADLFNVSHLKLTTTGTVAVGDGGYYGNVWPNTWPYYPTCQTQTHPDDYLPGMFVSTGYSNGGPGYCGLAQPSGMLGAFRVTGEGTIRLDNSVWHYAEDCVPSFVEVTLGEGAVTVSAGTGGGDHGGCSYCEEPVTVTQESAPKQAKRGTTWARVKAMYR